MNTISLFIRNAENAALMTQLLAQEYHVQVFELTVHSYLSTDLLIIDDGNLDQTLAYLRQLKNTTAPVHLPILLLARQYAIDALPDSVWAVIDDALPIPISKRSFGLKTTTLMRMRNYSLRLRALNDQLVEVNQELVALNQQKTALVAEVRTQNAALAQEIAERIRAEEALRASETQLHVSNRQLEELNASKDKFFSIIAHDLRSPFTVLLYYTRALSEKMAAATPAELQADVEKLRLAAERLYALLENLLTWARIQRGLMEWHPAAFDLNPMIRYNIQLFASNAERKQILLTTTVQEAVTAYADQNMINTVLRNLISNAVKFTPPGGKIAVSARQAAQAVEVTVADTGVGMDADALARLFRIDAQSTRAGTDGEKGTGLGLILCHDLVQKNGGRLWVNSETSKGTVFYLLLPRQPLPAGVQSTQDEFLTSDADVSPSEMRAAQVEAIRAPEPLAAPSQAHLKTLYEYAQYGNIKKIRKYVKQLAAAEPNLLPFLTGLSQLVDQFRMEQIEQYLAQYLAPEK